MNTRSLLPVILPHVYLLFFHPLSNRQLSQWFASVVAKKDSLLRFYADFSLLEESVALQEITRMISPLSSMTFTLPLYYEVDLAESKQRGSQQSEASPQTPRQQQPEAPSALDVLSETIDALGKLKESSTSFVSGLADSVWKAAPSVTLLSDIFSSPPKDSERSEPENAPASTQVEFARAVQLKKAPGQSLGLDLVADPVHGLVIG